MDGTRPLFHRVIEDADITPVPGHNLPQGTGPIVSATPCRVFVASQAMGSLAALSSQIHCRLEVDYLEHIGRLMEVAAESHGCRVALVLDCREPTMHPTSVAALADELPYGWWVVAWGIDDVTWDELEPDRRGSLHWVRCPEDADWHDVASLVGTLLSAVL